jgi:hypothetical protein
VAGRKRHQQRPRYGYCTVGNTFNRHFFMRIATWETICTGLPLSV